MRDEGCRLADDERRRDELVRANIGLARSVAARHRRARLTFDERLSACYLGLLRAAQHYRPGEGPFAPYAGRVMRRQIDADARGLRLIHVPRVAGQLAGQEHESIPRRRIAAAARAALQVEPIDRVSSPVAPDGDDQAEDLARVAGVLGRLDPAERDLLLARAEGRSHSELAAIAGVTRQAMYAREKRALARARAGAAPDGP